MIRGDDLLPSTPRQRLLVEAIGATYPVTGHLPMILGPDKKRLSKRHGAASVEEFRDAGYLPEAVLNYLALLGWSFDDSTRADDPRRARRALHDRARQRLAGRLRPPEAGLDERRLPARPRPAEYGRGCGRSWRSATRRSPTVEGLEDAAPLVQEKIGALGEFEDFAGFLFRPVVYEPEAWQRLAGVAEAGACWTARRRRSRRSTAS